MSERSGDGDSSMIISNDLTEVPVRVSSPRPETNNYRSILNEDNGQRIKNFNSTIKIKKNFISNGSIRKYEGA